MTYFSYLAKCNAPDNRLCRAALEVLEAESNRLVKNPKVFIRMLKKKIVKLNAQFPECEPLGIYTWTVDSRPWSGIGISFNNSFIVNFRLYPVREAV